MFKEYEISSCKISLGEGRELLYRYILLESGINISLREKDILINSYGISIVSEEIGGKEKTMYSETVKNVSPKKSEVVSLINFLMKNNVSPMHLIDIAGDKIDSLALEFDKEVIEIKN